MHGAQGQTKTVVIIGGGVSGVLTAIHLLQNESPPSILIVDPRHSSALDWRIRHPASGTC